MNQQKQDALLGILFLGMTTAYNPKRRLLALPVIGNGGYGYQRDKSVEERCEFRCITEK
ncbi:hypothetical protein [Mediterraneibacter sp.]|uniref:hypothetical protein n=1 Tax=Mediterraneibacter sp. TaxID=2316022 RepID=UPI0027B9AAD0|nr:hypothetical protein [Mediterraneibacter sp.]